MDIPEQFSLRWNNFHSNLSTGFHDLYKENYLVDVTLASADGRYIQAHKVVLSVCSPYFRQLFKINPCKHPIVILKDVSYRDLKDLVQFMYQGEVHVKQYDLPRFLKTAELLQIKGLTGDDPSDSSDQNDDTSNTEQYSESNNTQNSNKRQITDNNDFNRVPETNSQSEVLSTNKQSKSQTKSAKRIKTDERSNSPRSMIDVNDVELLDTVQAKQEPRHSQSDSEDYQNMKHEPDVTEFINNQMVGNAGMNVNFSDIGKQETKMIKNIFQCQICLKTFSRRDHLRTHEKNLHGEGVGPFPCSICSQMYKNTESLRKHIAKFHIPKVDSPFTQFTN